MPGAADCARPIFGQIETNVMTEMMRIKRRTEDRLDRQAEIICEPHFGNRTISTGGPRLLALRTRITAGVPLIGDGLHPERTQPHCWVVDETTRPALANTAMAEFALLAGKTDGLSGVVRKV